MGDIQRLQRIWDQIPKSVSSQMDLSQREIIEKYMDLFHFGDYFYVIFNTRTTQMEYVSPQLTKVLGYLPDEFRLSLLLENLHADDLPYYYHYEQSAVRFFTQLAPELFLKYKFAYDFRVKTATGIYKRVQQQIVPVYYFPEGGARTLVIFTDLTHFNISGIPKLSFIGMDGAPSFYNVHTSMMFERSPAVFSKKEQEILQLMAQGKKSEEISTLLNRSIFTIRNHRKNILAKSGCKNVQELLVQTIREGWV
ncbi:LuxR C-terminal-related transcriptional regulator [Chryseobacterium sp. MFBS3-17]|uniref:LuxR C-terminal-related transcriptional regulator n=1 Tax=Chryseobacterium sp. MFBS3-17 TaxID=2886689 RepID=UPI001D0E4A76|nr:LuxR C-terminal-related transcriptional regulator [Chryseobacterium sp. MFBS3-17]MCC2591674.1 LuxR C-terminal-related transcriptional regulator [Chryseobacterium sp. MFBS3-17]